MDYPNYLKILLLTLAIAYFIAGNTVYIFGIGPTRTREQRTMCLYLGSITCLLGTIVVTGAINVLY